MKSLDSTVSLESKIGVYVLVDQKNPKIRVLAQINDYNSEELSGMLGITAFQEKMEDSDIIG